MRTAVIPQLEIDSRLDFEAIRKVLRSGGTIVPIDSLNWPESFPYAPEANAYIAHSGECLSILYEVKGLDLRALELEDNAHSWENSCCEFFVGVPGSGDYMNFEMVCNGSLLVARGSGREDRVKLPSEKVAQIVRMGSLERKIYDERDKEFSWSIFIRIPFELIVGEGNTVPDTLQANFYKCANKSAHPHFLSWNPIKTPAPDFHRPEYFGTLILEK